MAEISIRITAGQVITGGRTLTKGDEVTGHDKNLLPLVHCGAAELVKPEAGAARKAAPPAGKKARTKK